MRNKFTRILFCILLLAAFLRLYRYNLADVINDEVFYGFRSIGLIDTINSPYQPTPFEWFTQVPGWARLSFHDHPPLGFYIQHIFFKIFGVNLFGLRLPFIAAGTISVYLVYLIAQLLFRDQRVSLLASAFLAVNNYHVWISRIGLQESLVIFFMLLSIWFFLKTISFQGPPSLLFNQSLYFYLTMITVGFSLLMKYTSIILIPIFLIYLLWKRRDLLSWKRIILSAILLLVILSPVIIYNFKLYQARGHFDFQISYLLKQKVPDWEIRPGRDVGGIKDKVQRFFTQFGKGYGAVFSGLSILALSLLYQLRKIEGVKFLVVVLGLLLLLFLFIGPQERFLSMLAPFLAILIAQVMVFLREQWKNFSYLLVVLLTLELAYTINTYVLVNPKGQPGWTYSILRYDHNLWGYNQLEDYLQKKMAGIFPERVFKLKYKFVEEIQDQAIERAKRQGKQASPIVFVTDTTMNGLPVLWYITRHTVYDGWPMVNSTFYQQLIADNPNYFADNGFQKIVFIKAGETLLRTDEEGIPAKELESRLLRSGITPQIIRNPNAKAAFRIYEF